MHTTLGRSGLETLGTLIMAGIADTRADAIRWALARIRERPASASGQRMNGSASGSGSSISSGASSEATPSPSSSEFHATTSG